MATQTPKNQTQKHEKITHNNNMNKNSIPNQLGYINDKKLREWANNLEIKQLKEIIDNLGNEFNILCDVWQKRMNNGQSRQDYKKKR